MNTDINKRYRLLKDLPDSNIGDIYIWNESMKAYYKDGNVLGSYWTSEYVESNTDWFEEVQPVSDSLKDNLEIYFSKHSDEDFYRLYSSRKDFDMIKAGKILELTLNDTDKHYKLDNEIVTKTIYSTEQPTNDNAFVWTDELVMEFLNEGEKFPNDWQRQIDVFKQSKKNQMLSEQKEDKDWEIVSYKSKTIFGFDALLKKLSNEDRWAVDVRLGYREPIHESSLPENKTIHSVRRLSDNAIFIVGEVAEQGKIKSFEICGKYMMACIINEDTYITINGLTKLSTPTQLVVEDKPPKGELMYNTLSTERIHFKTDFCDIMGCVKYDEKIHK